MEWNFHGRDLVSIRFSMALWSKQSGAATVMFTLKKEQVRTHVLRIGTTLSFGVVDRLSRLVPGRVKTQVHRYVWEAAIEQGDSHLFLEIDRLERRYAWSLSRLWQSLYLGHAGDCVQGRLKYS